VILVDTSVWIDLIAGRIADGLHDRTLEDFVTCGPVMQELLQGVRQERVRLLMERFEDVPRLSDPLPERLFWEAAEIFRRGRQSGATIRSPYDCLVAAIAIENDVPIWHHDRDFTAIAKYTTLREMRNLPASS
jgi:predicted nucleic acid-binding protein